VPNHLDVQKGLTDEANQEVTDSGIRVISDGDEEFHHLSRHRKGAADSKSAPRCGRNVWGVMLSRCVELAVVFVERQHPSDQSFRRQVELILVTQFQHPQHIATTTGFKCRKGSTAVKGASKHRHFLPTVTSLAV
jgi:hypothetical protein